MSKIAALIALPAGVLLGLDFFNVIKLESFAKNLDFVLIGAIILVALQILNFIMQRFSKEEAKITAFIVPTILAIPGILYIIWVFLPLELPINPEIVIAAFLFTEGLYALH